MRDGQNKNISFGKSQTYTYGLHLSWRARMRIRRLSTKWFHITFQKKKKNIEFKRVLFWFEQKYI